MENLCLSLDFFKVDKKSTYEGLLQVLGKEFMVCLNEEMVVRGAVMDGTIILIMGASQTVSLNKRSFKIEEIGESFYIKFRISDDNFSYFELKFSNLAKIELDREMSVNEFHRCMSMELISKLRYDAQKSGRVRVID